jgi:hypothetical protein
MSDSLTGEIVAELIDMGAAKSQHGIPAMSFGEAPLTRRLP